MSVTAQLKFNPTDADSIAASHSVGAYVRAGTDGDLIGSETLNSVEWLRTAGPIIDSSGNEVGVTSNQLDVNVAGFNATDVDIRSLDHTTAGDADSIRLGDGTNFFTSTSENGDIALDVHLSNTEIAVIQGSDSPWTVDATDLDIRSLDHTSAGENDSVRLGDGTDFITSTLEGGKQALDVYVANDIDVDDGIADTAIENTATAVSTTAVNVVSSALAARKYLYLANQGNKYLYFGKTGVTTANGFPMASGEKFEFRIGPSVTPQIIGGTGASSEDLRVMELS